MKREVFLLLLIGLSLAAPQAYVTEEVEYTYAQDGSVSGGGTGYIEIAVGNTVDVLQGIVLELTQTTDTDLEDARAFRGVAASPAGGQTRLFFNTTENSQSLTYTISNSSQLGVILNISYGNYVGGTDLTPGTNLFWFNVTLTANSDIEGVIFNITIPDGLGAVAAMNVSLPNVTGGLDSFGRTDRNGDGHYDYIYWMGNLTSTGEVAIKFNGTIIPDINFDADIMYVDLGDMRAYTEKTGADSTSTLTGIGIVEGTKLARGPVQEGIELLINPNNAWVRGFIRNLAKDSGLIYMINSWELYRVDSFNELDSGTPGSILSQGNTFYTDQYNSADGKQYFRAAFDWSVLWGESQYTGKSTSTRPLPTLYEIDISSSTVLEGATEDTVHSVLATASVIHIGHAEVGLSGAYWNMSLPCSGATTDWAIENAILYYSNATNTSIRNDIAFASSTQDCLGGAGYARFEAADISTILNRNLTQNDYLIFEVNVSGTRPVANDTYYFNSTFLGITTSGTPYSIKFDDSLFLEGVGESEEAPRAPAGEGAGGGAASSMAVPLNRAIELRMNADSVDREANIEVVAGVSGVPKGISDVNIELLVPTKAVLDEDEVEVYVRGSKTPMEPRFVRVREVGGENYNVYVYGVWALKNGDRLEFKYPVTLGVGTNNLLANFKGYDSELKRSVSSSVSRIIRIPVPPSIVAIPSLEAPLGEKSYAEAEGFEMWADPFEIVKAEVNSPVEWKKGILVYNQREARDGLFRVAVFPDTFEGVVIDVEGAKISPSLVQEGNNTYLEWTDRLYRVESKKYFVTVYTPPVVGSITSLDVINTSADITYFQLDFSLESLALEEYKNLTYHLPLEVGVVEQVFLEGEGMEFTYDPFRVFIPNYPPMEKKGGYLIYKDKPPQLLVFSDLDEYLLDSTIDMTAVVITEDALEGVYAEIEVIGPAPGYNTIFYDTIDLGDLEGASINRVPYPLSLAGSTPGIHTIRVKLRKNMWTILDGQKEFEVTGEGLPSEFFIVVVLLAVLITLGFSVYRIRRLGGTEIEKAEKQKARCVMCGTGFTDKRMYRCERCHKPVCFEHVKFFKGRLYCEKCSGLEKVDHPAGQ